ncbi:MAG: 2-dehydro-3-deoxygluconokinase [Thermomicrobiales bacterium]|jgi:2-dehydro-3-deoxygluconokinase|nr:2-dehydro-3-deoxygluconokinase [Thermomicrobiales bacterium]MEA2584214.1 2-dehydro-3-deoxygluconokinase [Thermomicrobiales bacterium]
MERQSNTHGNRVVTFGEAMIRLTPPGNERVERTISLNLSPGGAELNTAVTLACLGINASWISRLPENPLGRYLDRQAKAHGVDTSGVQWVPEREGRMGLYFLEEGVDPRPSAVTYDRAGSAMANLSPGAFEWSEIFAGVAAFHISGITPAISEGARAESFAAVRAANAAGVPVFFDLNYRSKLWTEEEARACFVELAPLVDVMFAGRGSMRTFFGIEGSHEEVMREARNRLGVAACVLTRKKATASRTLRLRSMAVGKTDEFVQTDWRDIEVVDRLGGGDAFAGGFIAGYLEDSENLARAVNLGLAASALKHTVPGDFLAATRAEIEAAATADAVAVLQR